MPDSNFALLKRIFNNFDPYLPLPAGDPAYVDCREVRGDDDIVADLGRKIQFADDPERPRWTCQLYAGHRGAGKSTELARLTAFLREAGYRVVYFAADDEDLDPEDAQYEDILFCCVRNLMQDLRGEPQNAIARWMQARSREIGELLNREISFENVSVEAQLTEMAKLTATIKASPNFRQQIRRLIEPNTPSLIEALNEFIAKEMAKQPEASTRKLVLIADNLDRITPIYKSDNHRTNHDAIFIDRSGQLRALNCHVIYTVPISLMHSDRAVDLKEIYGAMQILPMVMVQTPDGQPYGPGIATMQEFIKRRVQKAESGLRLSPDVFASVADVERFCRLCGGHVRDLMLLMQAALKHTSQLPIPTKTVNRALSEVREVYRRTVNEDCWPVLVQVYRTKDIENDARYRNLLFRRCILEYRYIDDQGEAKCWYDVHPLICELQEFQDASAATPTS